MNSQTFEHEKLCWNGRLAVDLARAGLWVFPCLNNPSHPQHKRPMLPWGSQSSCDPAIVKSWWQSKFRYALPGIDIGKSQIIVLDGDIHHSDQDGPAELENILGQLDNLGAPGVITPSGGVHLYFRQPSDAPPLGNSVGDLPPGIDVRGNGGFVVAPGAVTGDKKPYRQMKGTPSLLDALYDASIPVLPDIVIERIRKGKDHQNNAENLSSKNKRASQSSPDGNRERQYAFAALDAEAHELATTLKGGRNAALNVAALKLARHVAAGRLSRAEIYQALLDACLSNGLISDDGKPAFEKTFESGFRKGMSDPAPPLNDRKGYEVDDEIMRLGREAAEAILSANENYSVDPETGEIFENNTTADHQARGNKSREQKTKIELEIVNAASCAGKPVPEQLWLIPDLIPSQNVTILSGDGATGKSLLALQLAVAVATGGDWLGWSPQVGRVAYVSAEDETDELHRRLDRMLPDLSRLGNLDIVPLAGKDAVLAAPTGKDGLLAETPLYTALRRVIDRLHVEFLVLDNLADVFGGDEIKKVHARQFIAMLRRIALEDRVTILLLSHPSQSGMNNGSGTSGNVAWNNSVRSRLYFERKLHFEGQRVIEDDRDIRILSTKKNNRAPNGGQILVRYDRGQFVRERGVDASPDNGRAAERVFLTLLELFASQGRDVSHSPSSTYAPTVFEKHSKAEGHTKRSFEKAMNRLLDAGKIEVEITGPPSRQRKRLVLKRSGEAFEADAGGES